MKAQIWSIDFAISVLIFITTITIIFFTFNITSNNAARQKELTQMQDLSLEVTESLIRTSGVPEDWTSASVQVIGLAARHDRPNETRLPRENVINETALLRFLSVNYNQSKVLMGLGIYEYYLDFVRLNGSLAGAGGSPAAKGLNYTNARDIILVRRPVLLGNSLAHLRFYLWR